MDARITREETALLLNLASPAHTEVELLRLEAMRSRDAAIGTAVVRTAKTVWHGIRATLAFLAAYPKRRRVLGHLNQLTDRELADIGLTRGELTRVFDEDFAAARETKKVGLPAHLRGAATAR
jgi:uncharacterized protein YjiS (DUF1127 family)